MTLKLNIGDPKTAKSHKKDLTEDESKILFGKKLGEVIKGDSFGLSGYEFEITGGSDNSGFPMRKDVNVAGKKRILTTSEGIGFKDKRKGLRKRRTVAGNTIYAKTVQVNLKITKYGKQPLDTSPEPATEGDAPIEEETPKEEKADKPKEKKVEKAKEEPTEEKAEESPVEESSEEPAKEKKAEDSAENKEAKTSE